MIMARIAQAETVPDFGCLGPNATPAGPGWVRAESGPRHGPAGRR